jgi:hypothetical protein
MNKSQFDSYRQALIKQLVSDGKEVPDDSPSIITFALNLGKVYGLQQAINLIRSEPVWEGVNHEQIIKR